MQNLSRYMTHIMDQETTCEKTAKSESPPRGHEIETNRDAQRAIPPRIVDAPWRRYVFQSLSIKELALNSDFKVVNVLVLNGRWLWGKRGSRKTHYRLCPRRNPKCSRSRSSRSEEQCVRTEQGGPGPRFRDRGLDS
jgi:hypothetical protein